jgi:sugar phosphate isomerase/epimerase
MAFSRRNVLGMFAAAAPALATAPAFAAAKIGPLLPARYPLGIQFFSFNSLASTGWDGFAASMKTARDIGYDSIELPGLMGQPADKIRVHAEALGLGLHSFHMGNDQVRAARKPGESIPDVQDVIYTPAGVVEVARINLPIARDLGCTWGVIAASGRSNFTSRESVLRLGDSFNQANKLAHDMGMRLSYHMHAPDFVNVDDFVPFDLLVANTDASIRYQLDVCWAAAAGRNPAELIRNHHQRIVSLHLKDLAANRTQSATAGDGILDFADIHAASALIKEPLFYVERDGAPGIDPVREASRAFDYLRPLGWGISQ